MGRRGKPGNAYRKSQQAIKDSIVPAERNPLNSTPQLGLKGLRGRTRRPEGCRLASYECTNSEKKTGSTRTLKCPDFRA